MANSEVRTDRQKADLYYRNSGVYSELGREWSESEFRCTPLLDQYKHHDTVINHSLDARIGRRWIECRRRRRCVQSILHGVGHVVAAVWRWWTAEGDDVRLRLLKSVLLLQVLLGAADDLDKPQLDGERYQSDQE